MSLARVCEACGSSIPVRFEGIETEDLGELVEFVFDTATWKRYAYAAQKLESIRVWSTDHEKFSAFLQEIERFAYERGRDHEKRGIAE